MSLLRLNRSGIEMNKPGRNDPCPCGSGKKFKKCCLDKPHQPSPELLADLELGQQRIREYEEEQKKRHYSPFEDDMTYHESFS